MSSCGMFLASAVRLPNREDPGNEFDMGPNWHLKHAEALMKTSVGFVDPRTLKHLE